MTHSWQWQDTARQSSKLYRTGVERLHRPPIGFTCGSYNEGVRCTSTTAYTLLIPVLETRYYVGGFSSGKTSYNRLEIKPKPICGYERTGRTTGKGTVSFKHTHRKYVSQSPRTSQAIVGVLRTSIRKTTHPLITPVDGGGVPELLPDC